MNPHPRGRRSGGWIEFAAGCHILRRQGHTRTSGCTYHGFRVLPAVSIRGGFNNRGRVYASRFLRGNIRPMEKQPLHIPRDIW